MHSTSLHNQNLGEVGKYWVLCIRLCVRQIIVMCEIWKICYIVYMCEWYSPATRQHDLQQRWWRKSFFVQLIWALGEWNYVMPCSNISTSFSRLLQFRNSVRATDNFFKSQSPDDGAGSMVTCSVPFPGWSGVVRVQLWLIRTMWCSWGMRFNEACGLHSRLKTNTSSFFLLASFHPFLSPTIRQEGR